MMDLPPPPLTNLGVVPVLIGPLQVLLAILPWLLGAVLGALVSLFKPRAMWTTMKLAWRLKGPVLLAVALVLGAGWGLKTLLPSGTLRASSLQSGGDWPMFHGDLSRRGAVPGETGPGAAGLRWTVREPDVAFFASPAISGNQLFIATARMSPFRQSGEIWCLDADTGAIAWRSSPRGYRPTFASPSIWRDNLVCGEGLHDTRNARVICLDLRPGREGNVRWTFATASHVECTPVIAEGRVYVGAGDDGYYCLELEPDPHGNARLVWHVPGAQYPDTETSLAVHQGRVYAGLGVTGKALVVLDATTGRELARIPTPYPVFGPPAIAPGPDGRDALYVGMGNGDYVHNADELGLPNAGEVWCLDPSTLAVHWKYATPQTVLGAVAVADDQLYFASRDGRLHALDRAGRLLAVADLHAPIITSPAVCERFVYIVTKAGTLHALLRGSLQPAWDMTLGTPHPPDQPGFISSPLVARGRVFLGTQYDGLVSAGFPGTPRKFTWPGHLGGPGAAGNPLDAPLPAAGAFHWQFPSDQPGSSTARITAPVACVADNLLAPLRDPAGAALVCLRDDHAQQQSTLLWRYPLPLDAHRSPAILGDTALIADGLPGQPGRRLHALDLATGSLRWHHPIEPHASGILLATPDDLLVQDHADRLTCLDDRGQMRWSQPLAPLAAEPAVGPTLIVAATLNPPALAVLDRLTGTPIWRVELPATPVGSPLVHDLTIDLPTDRGIERRRLADGSPDPRWQGPASPMRGSLALTRGNLLALTADGRLLVLDNTGRALASVDGVLPHSSFVLARGAAWFTTASGVMRWDPADGNARPARLWADTSWLAAPTAPATAGPLGLYMGIDGWGLVKFGGQP